MKKQFALALLASTVLSACGGGDSSPADAGPAPVQAPPAEQPAPGESETPPPTEQEVPDSEVNVPPSSVLLKAYDFSKQQVAAAARTLADESYNGSAEQAEVDPVLAQAAYRYVFADAIVSMPYFSPNMLQEQANEDGSVKVALNCEYQGTVTIEGQFEPGSYAGTVVMQFDDCLDYSYSTSVLSGVAAMTIEGDDTFFDGYSLFFDELKLEEGETLILSGVVDDGYSTADDVDQRKHEQYLTVQLDDAEYFMDTSFVWRDVSTEDAFKANGRFAEADTGLVDFEMSSSEQGGPYWTDSTLTFNDNTARLRFVSNWVLYEQDTNKDGQFDQGLYLNDVFEYAHQPLSDTTLVPLAELSIAPEVGQPEILSESQASSRKNIEVVAGNIVDIDTPAGELEQSFNWYINDELVEGNHSAILPAYSFSANDYITVTSVVNDGTHQVESYPTTIWVEDAPLELSINDLPDMIQAGETIEIPIVITTTDLPDETNIASFIGGPEGASMNSEGVLTWTAPASQLFETQHYTFNFGNRFNPVQQTEATFDVKVVSDKPLPLMRSGTEIPGANNSHWVGDFDGDGNNELLGTDNNHRVFLQQLTNNKLQQTWLYPYSFGDEQQIIQVLASDADQNGTLEILVITNHAVWMIDDLNSKAKRVLSSDENTMFRAAAVQDTNDDGLPELILAQGDSWYDGTGSISVVSVNNWQTPLLTFSIDAFHSMTVGNVDNDAAWELVTNTGLVYDLTSGANEWLLGSGFSTGEVTTADLDGNDVEEIVAVDGFGDLYIYSAVDRTQWGSLELFNTCDINSLDLQNDGIDEVVVSDCQWGDVTAYSWDQNNALTIAWQVGLQDHGSTSLAAGDIDNDGDIEVLWGTGASSSAGNQLIVADVTATSATIKSDVHDAQLDSFTASGWSSLTGNDERAVFFTPSTNNGYDESRFITLTSTGELTVSAPISSNWDGSYHTAVTDFNNDGAGDIFVPATVTYDSAFAAIQLHNGEEQWSVAGANDGSIGRIQALDVNQDGYDDAIVLDRRALKIYDVQNQVLLANVAFDTYMQDFDAALVDGEILVVVSTPGDNGSNLELLSYHSSGLTFRASTSASCSSLVIHGTADDKRLACAPSFGQDQFVSFALRTDSLTPLSTQSLDYRIAAMVAHPSEPSRLIVAENLDSWTGGLSQLRVVTQRGDTVWKSPSLIGNANDAALSARPNGDGGIEVLYGTYQGMYWLQ